MNLASMLTLLKMDLVSLQKKAERLPKHFANIIGRKVTSAQEDIFAIERLILAGREAEVFIRIAESAYPRMKKAFFKPNYDYDEGWSTILDEFRAGKIRSIEEAVERRRDKKKQKNAGSYCGKDDFESYWEELDEEGEEALEDFLKYIRKITC